MAASHGAPLRGLKSAAVSAKFEGRFGRMFRHLPPAKYAKTDTETTTLMTHLGEDMTSKEDLADPKDGADTEESGIPALYTYFGQFIDHDLTFGPEGIFQKIKDPNAVVDFRTPAFDLDCVYGRGPGDQPYMYDGDPKFLVGYDLAGGSAKASDLPRNSKGRALIGDPRNDENILVSQLQGLFLSFHNKMVDTGLNFLQAQQATQRHYQYVILNDFLPRIINSDVLDELRTDGEFDADKLLYYDPLHYPFMPVEFATAGYRFGHSMIRPGYHLNASPNTLLPIFDMKKEDLRGKRPMPAGFGLDWAQFIDTEARPYDGAEKTTDQARRLQYAYKIDTSVVNPLANLPPIVAANPASLAQRNLRRSVDYGLPSGETVAWRMGATPLDETQVLIGKADGSGATQLTQVRPEYAKAFINNTPLWTYILAEAMAYAEGVAVQGSEVLKNDSGAPQNPGGIVMTPRLGPVGGRIVAETFLGLMFADETSLLGSDEGREWVPDSGADYKLKDFVAFAATKAAGTGA